MLLAVKTLQPVNAQVARAIFRVCGVHQRQGEKGATVIGPADQHRQPIQIGGMGNGFQDRPVAHLAQPCRGKGQQIPTGLEDALDAGRHQRSGKPQHPLAQLGRIAAEGQTGSPAGAEQVGDGAVGGTRDVFKKQGRSAAGHHPVLDDGHLLIGVHTNRNAGQITGLFQMGKKSAQIDETQRISSHVREGC